MKKIIVMLATLIMSFAFAISVMAAPSPEDEPLDDNPTTSEKQETQEKIDKKTQIIDDEFYDGKKDSDNGNGNGSSSKTTTTTTSSSSTSSTSTSSSPKTGDQGAPVTLVYASLAAAALAVYAAKHVKEQY